MIGLYGLDEHGPVLVPIDVEYAIRRWLRTRSVPEKEDCEMRRVSALEVTDLEAADWIQYHPLLRHISASLFTELTYLVLPDGSSFAVPGGSPLPMPSGAIVTIPANTYLVKNSATEYTIMPKAQWEALWEVGP